MKTVSMQFTTPVTIQKSSFPIDHESEIFSLGSCFAVNMAEKLTYFGFRNTVNPFGILFHPLAIEKFVGAALSGQTYAETDIFFHNEGWHCFDAHSDLSHPDKQTLLSSLNAALEDSAQKMRNSTHFLITLGTAWVYRTHSSNALVANCHKVAQKEFAKELLPVSVIEDSLQLTVDAIKKANPSARILFTVSPVRHIKDGMVQNQRSKAHLISGVHAAVDSNESVHYFPSYEIMTDELRDYRFYAPDMLHPSPVAVDYIWEKFRDSWISEASFPVMSEIDAVRKALAHRPFNAASDQHQKFLSSLENRMADLRKRLPYLGFD